MMTTPTYCLYLGVRPLLTLSPQCAPSANFIHIPPSFVADFLFPNPQFSALRLHHNPKQLLILAPASVRAI